MSEVQFEILEDDSTDENEGQPYFYLAQDSEDSDDSEGDETAPADRMASPDTTSGDRAASPINASGGAAPHKRIAPTISPTSPDTPSATASTGATPTRHIPSPSTVSPDSQLTPFASPGLCSNAGGMVHSLLPSTLAHIQNTATNDEGEKRKSEAVATTGRESNASSDSAAQSAKGLPDGWTKGVVPRKTDDSKKKSDNFWFSPLKYKFNSKPQVHRFCACLEQVDGDEAAAYALYLKGKKRKPNDVPVTVKSSTKNDSTKKRKSDTVATTGKESSAKKSRKKNVKTSAADIANASKEELSSVKPRRQRQMTSSSLPARKIISLAKLLKKPPVKCPMFMTTPTSIYGAVCNCPSLLDALHGGDGSRDGDSDGDEEDGDIDCSINSRTGGLEGKERWGAKKVKLSLNMIQIHFGGCPIFKRDFDAILSERSAGATAGTKGPSIYLVEQELHRSVRHMCDNKCFFWAYHSVREFTTLWRDILIDPTGRCGPLSKESLLSGWSCRLCPTVSNSAVVENLAVVKSGTKKKAKGPSAAVVFVSPNGTKFHTKANAINHMNKLLPSTQRPTLMPFTFCASITHSTTLISTTAAINSWYSPLGLLEELFLDDPWKLLVSAIFLNKTNRSQVDGVLHRFLKAWPNAKATAGEAYSESTVLEANAESTTREAHRKEISTVISPLGLGVKRAENLIKFSKDYLKLTSKSDPVSLTKSQVMKLHGVGEYGWAAYEIFILKRLPSKSVEVCDHVLQLYAEYQLGQRAAMADRQTRES